MAESQTTPSRATQGRTSTNLAQLSSEHGTTTIDDAVVAKVAGLAAREVDGVAELGGAISNAVSSVVGRIRGNEHRTTGVGVEVGSKQAAVDLTMKVIYPTPIHEVADAVRNNVIDRIQSLTGLEVTEVNVAITDLVFGDENTDQSSGRVE
jgi:uncharacterized alkaline shock family protein YloU